MAADKKRGARAASTKTTQPAARKAAKPVEETRAPAGKARKASSRAQKVSSQAQKASSRAQKASSRAQKVSSRAQKVSSRAQKVSSRAQKVSGSAGKEGELSAKDDKRLTEQLDALEQVDLQAPARAGRGVVSLGDVLLAAEVRLKLAFLHRAELDPVLPSSPPFHAHAWTALVALRGEGAGNREAANEEKAAAALENLVAKVGILRTIVSYTTRPGDAARQALSFGTVLKATSALVEQAPAMIEGARKVRTRFPAMTDAVLGAADEALARAQKAVSTRRSRQVSTAVQRADQTDPHQLALDVLLDSIDHLRAAALVALSASRPRLAAALTAPLEASRAKADEEPPPPAPAPTPAAPGG